MPHPAVFEPADVPRHATFAFWNPEQPGDLTVVTADGPQDVDAVRLPLPEALAEPALRSDFWGAATRFALGLVARGRILPTVTADGTDAWRCGPLDTADLDHLRDLAEAMPPQARAVPLPGTTLLPDALILLRAFLDAVADTLPRNPDGKGPYSGPEEHHVPELRAWTEEISAGLDSGVRISLRVEADDNQRFSAVVQAHPVTTAGVVADAAQLWDGDDPRFGERARLDTVLALRRAALVWDGLGPLLIQAVPDRIDLDDEEVSELLGGALAGTGVDVHWPRDLMSGLNGLGGLTAKAVLGKRDAAPSDVRSFLGGDGLLSFDWQLALGDSPLTEAEMDQLAEAHRPVVRLRDRWVLVDPETAARARGRDLKPITALDALGAALTGTADVDGQRVEVAATPWLEALRARIADPDGAADDGAGDAAESTKSPAGLHASLRDYQLRGLRWLDRMTSLGLGGCLADDMGLGKTITLIALHLHRQADEVTAGPTLVVCPASLLGNWQREIEKFAPGTPVRRFHGAGRDLDGLESGFVLTTYGTMRLDAERLNTVGWGLLVADEAQHVKNHSSGTAKELRRIGARARVALTGTPVENNLSELWAILDWTTPGLLGSLTGFRRRWAKPIEADHNRAASEQLSRLVRPFLLRRRKSDPGIAPELPPKTETDRVVSLTAEQAGLYEATVREILDLIADADGMERRGLIVKLLTGLKQICNHPAQYLHETDPRLPGRSGKLELLDELLDTILAEGGSVLVFTQYVAMARLLEQHLAARSIKTQLLHGGTPVPRREEMVDRFQNGDVPVFLLSLKAAGTGLNLTQADHVVHFDRWWNPAVEDQATDRAYRIGQTRPVQVHRLIAEGTVEDRIAQMLDEKRALADAVLSGGEAALTELSDAELAELVTLRSAP